MSLHESDIMDRLRSSTREAIQACRELSVQSRRGSPYETLRDNLVLIEGCCRQMAIYRDDGRWLPFGVFAANIHQRAGDWLRGYVKNGVHIIWTPGHINEAFVKLAGELAVVLEGLENLAVMKTGRRGPILPATPAEERRMGRPAFDNRPKKAQTLLLPPKYRQPA